MVKSPTASGSAFAFCRLIFFTTFSYLVDVVLEARKSTPILQNLQVEYDIDTVVRVLQPGPLGIIEHRFSAEEIRKASATVEKSVANWRRAAILEQRNDTLKDYIEG